MNRIPTVSPWRRAVADLLFNLRYWARVTVMVIVAYALLAYVAGEFLP